MDASIRLIRLPSNMGPATARNVGVAAARGRYILFLDSDALMGRRSISGLVRRMEADPRLGIIGCRIVNAVRCVPPANLPQPVEVRTCNRFLRAELQSIRPLRAVLAQAV